MKIKKCGKKEFSVVENAIQILDIKTKKDLYKKLQEHDEKCCYGVKVSHFLAYNRGYECVSVRVRE